MPISVFTYHLIARGKIIRSETISIETWINNYAFKFPATFDLAPTAHLVVYYFKGNDIQSAHTKFDIRDDLNNYLTLKLSTPKAKAGATVDIDISTNPNSYVGLLGVDQSVLLMKKNDGLSEKEAFAEIEKYQQQVNEKKNFFMPYKPTPHYSNRYWNDFRVWILILMMNERSISLTFKFYLFSRVKLFC